RSRPGDRRPRAPPVATEPQQRLPGDRRSRRVHARGLRSRGRARRGWGQEGGRARRPQGGGAPGLDRLSRPPVQRTTADPDRRRLREGDPAPQAAEGLRAGGGGAVIRFAIPAYTQIPSRCQIVEVSPAWFMV